MDRNEKERKSTLEEKRERVLNKKRKFPFFPLLAAVGIVVMGYVFINNLSGATGSTPKGTFNIGQEVDYTNKEYTMSVVETAYENGKFYVDLNELKEKTLVKFMVPGKTVTMPSGKEFDMGVLAYVAPSGRVVGAVSVCEPCNGVNFRIDGRDKTPTLVCEACGSIWTLEQLKGLAGGCPDYPPDELYYTVEGNKIAFSEAEVRAWQPREADALSGY